MITFKDVSKKFGSIVALEGISFTIEPGEFAFITGPSGSGKTTLLRIILRELMPDAGDVLFGGKSIAELKSQDIPFYRRRIGVVFQDFKLLHDRTVGENVELALAVFDEPEEKQLSRAHEVLSRVGLAERVDAFPSQLAGGELQRAVFARALAHSPKLLLADEPTGNLDPDTAWEIVELMNDINKDGTTVLMATHNHDIVDRMKRHVIELRGGKIVRDQEHGKYKVSDPEGSPTRRES